MSYEKQFRIMLNHTISKSDLQKELLTKLSCKQDKDYGFIIFESNNLRIIPNEDYNPNLAKTSEDYYLYYKFVLEVFPINNIVSVQNQVDLAKTLLQFFRQMKIDAEVIADFEHLVDS